ncbi:MAG: DUF1501 domain-containing protein [Rhodocyclaceae bacterium]|nr:DUF1501 domain-containing protein [Rhodocyclaceae bacterium]
MHRRQFLAFAAASPLAGLCWSTRLWAAPEAGSRLLVVFLRGGYDGLSLLVPRSGFYAEARPRLALAVAGGATPGAIALDADWALHPVLADTLLPLARAGQLRFVPFAGTEDLSRSHFETQDSMELGLPIDARRDYSSGFMNRLAARLSGAAPIAFTEQLPLILRGSAPAANLSVRGKMAKSGLEALQPAISAMYRDHPLQSRVEEAFALQGRVRQDAAGAMQAGMAAGGSGNKGFETEARRIAGLMRESHRLGFVDMDGWDTHIGQCGASSEIGILANRLGELGRGLAALADTLGAQEWRRTVVVVISEFGRTVRENGSRGTDHGHGNTFLVLGGGLAAARAGSPVAGEQQAIEAATLFQNRDLPVLNEYRALLGGIMARQFGLDARALEAVFPQARPRDLGLL